MRRIALFIGLSLYILLFPIWRVAAATPTPDTTHNSVCYTISDSAQQSACLGCMKDNTQVWTAIGCIGTGNNPTDFLTKIMGLGIGIAGGIAFLLILFGGLQIMTSAGNPEQLNAGRELVSSAVTGLLLIIFSVFLLQFIGVSIIGIPGFK